MAKSLGRIISPEILYSALFTYFSASAANILKSSQKKVHSTISKYNWDTELVTKGTSVSIQNFKRMLAGLHCKNFHS
jgi:hypothetical protein